MDTGFPSQDAKTDFSRARRQALLARLASGLRREPDDVTIILPFEEVIEALGYRGERRLGLETISLDSIVGTVDRSREFDRRFRPTSGRVRSRWERIASAVRRGEPLPPIDVYRIGELHFVKDGHHRVSVARQLRLGVIDAYVTEVLTSVGANRQITLEDLPMKSHERLFFERVPLPPEARSRMQLSHKSRYAELAESVEAWGFRAMQERREFMTREEVAEAWYRDEYDPVLAMLREADLIGNVTEAEAYLVVGSLRYLLLRTHEWDDDVIERLRSELSRSSPREQGTAVRRLRGELGR